MSNDSLGRVETKIFIHKDSFSLKSGKTLQGFEMVYQTYGELNEAKDNAILICHALSGNHHVAGLSEDDKKGWWDDMVGPNKAFDTNKYFIVGCNNLGGCHGSTGPNSINPDNNIAYGSSFPMVTVEDWVKSQYLLLTHLGLLYWYAVVGGSLGGMQALQWSIDYPDLVKKIVVVAAAAKLSAQNIAFNEIARQAILADPNYDSEDKLPKTGLGLARMLGHITYLSDDAMREKFGRDMKKGEVNFSYDVEFEVESYLRYQGESFSNRFDAHTYLLMTKVLDYFDPAESHEGDLAKTLKSVTAKTLLIAFSSDWRFSPERSRELANAFIEAEKDVSFLEIDSPHGHDAFLMPSETYDSAIETFLEKNE